MNIKMRTLRCAKAAQFAAIGPLTVVRMGDARPAEGNEYTRELHEPKGYWTKIQYPKI